MMKDWKNTLSSLANSNVRSMTPEEQSTLKRDSAYAGALSCTSSDRLCHGHVEAKANGRTSGGHIKTINTLTFLAVQWSSQSSPNFTSKWLLQKHE